MKGVELWQLKVMMAVLVILIVSLVIFNLPPTIVCMFGDEECLDRSSDLRESCSPSTSIITVGNSTNNLTIKVTTYIQDGICYTVEEVIDDSDSGVTNYDLTGYEAGCAISPEDFEKYGQLACNGSLLGFLSPDSVSEGSGFDDSGGGGDVFYDYCSLDADNCREETANHVLNCIEAEILMDLELENTQTGTSYWTLYILIEVLPEEYLPTMKLPERCSIYHELINAVNLPPEIPPHIIGSNMTCVVEMSKFPISDVSINWCSGDLVDYIKLIYP